MLLNSLVDTFGDFVFYPDLEAKFTINLNFCMILLARKLMYFADSPYKN